MSVQIIRGNALDLPLEDNSVDLVVTSPPYFALRSYTDQGTHYDGQLGSEATPAEFVDALIKATAEMVRVVKPSGSIFVNLGDKYSSGNGGASRLTQLGERLGTGGGQKSDKAKQRAKPVPGMKPKSLLGLPWRYALACIDDLGLILRAEIIWAKPNGLPESVTDRVRRSHEQWFHFTLEPRYYSAVDTIREAHTGAGLSDVARGLGYVRTTEGDTGGQDGTTNRRGTVRAVSPLGKLPGSVWTIPTQPLTVPAELGVDHFAAFPMEWPRRIIRGWSPAGVCTVCGQGRRPVVDKERMFTQRTYTGSRAAAGFGNVTNPGGEPWLPGRDSVTITGEACGCDTPTAPTRPAVVLDPFGGTGTTALIAHALGRHGITIDMSADYCRLAEWRCNDPGQIAAAMQVDKPEPVSEDQLGFDFEESAS